LIGLPLIFFKARLPEWLESGAEKAIGAVVVVLALRVICKWMRGDYHTSAHGHSNHDTDVAHERRFRHLRRGRSTRHRHVCVRTPQQALGIGMLHGLAGTGAIVLLLIAALPTKLEAATALAAFAPMSMVSMALCTSAFAWVLTRPAIEPVYRSVLVPALGVFALLYGTWYAGML
jgi:hypothetical protein